MEHVTLKMMEQDIIVSISKIKQSSKIMARINADFKAGLMLHKVSESFSRKEYERSSEHLTALIEYL